MSENTPREAEKSQSDKFKDAAPHLETDDDEQRFKERLGKLVKHKPVPEKLGDANDA